MIMEKKIKTHRDLEVWKLGIQLVMHTYTISRNFPPEEKFGLSLQMRKSSVSVPSNIAEGAGRTSSKEDVNFLNFARGSLSELETQNIICFELGFIENIETSLLVIKRISLILNALSKRISNN